MTTQNRPNVQAPGNIRISPDEESVLQRMFGHYARVAIEAEFGMGFSGCRVFRVRPVESGGLAHTLALVKIGPIRLIEKEWQAYETWVRNRLPGIAWVTSEPIIPGGSSWGGLRYELVGGGIFAIQSLSQYYRQASVDDILWVLQRRLFPVMSRSWWLVSRVELTFRLQSDYDQLLPVNLMIGATDPLPDDEITILRPGQLSLFQTSIGDHVRLQEFAITEVDEARNLLTLNIPRSSEDRLPRSFRVRVQDVSESGQYRVGGRIDSMDGIVTDKRHTMLEALAGNALGEGVDLSAERIRLIDGTTLPNPLHSYQEILYDTFLDVNLSTIHGDFNLENILVDPETREVKVIDFATVHQGHALHDLLRLETEIVTKLIPEALNDAALSPETILPFYQRLHLASFGRVTPAELQLPHRMLEKPFATLVAIRQEASRYLFSPEDHSEYYRGLLIYLLGALKFKNLDAIPNAKAVAFYAAATTADSLHPETEHSPPLIPRRRSLSGNTLRAMLTLGLILLTFLAIITRPRDDIEVVDVSHLCAVDNEFAVDIVEGPNAHLDMLAYFEAANPELYGHLAAVEQIYLDGQEQKGLTYVWGSPGVGKTFLSTRRLNDGFPGDSCLIKLGDLFGDDAEQLGFEVIRKPDLATLDDQIPFDDLPAIADTQTYDLKSLFSAGGCFRDDALVPLIIIDDLDEVHSETSKAILRSVDRFILEVDLSQQKFVHIVVLGRPEGFAPWYQDSERYDDENIVPILNTFRLRGPEFLSSGDIAFLADNQNSFARGQETWEQMKQDGQADEHVEAYVSAVTRHPFLTYSVRALATANMLTDRAVTQPNDTEAELKGFLFEALLERAADVHGRPLSSDDRYLLILEEIAAKYASEDQVDDEGFFTVSASDTVPVMENGREVGEVFVRDVLDHSGIAILKPASQSTTIYRFEPFWVHPHLVELRNLRRDPDHLYRACHE